MSELTHIKTSDYHDLLLQIGRIGGASEMLIAERDRLRAERDTLRQDAERLRDARLFPAGYELYRTSEIIAERKDAERYRWLCASSDREWGEFSPSQLIGRLDEAIDAARAALKAAP